MKLSISAIILFVLYFVTFEILLAAGFALGAAEHASPNGTNFLNLFFLWEEHFTSAILHSKIMKASAFVAFSLTLVTLASIRGK